MVGESMNSRLTNVLVEATKKSTHTKRKDREKAEERRDIPPLPPLGNRETQERSVPSEPL